MLLYRVRIVSLLTISLFLAIFAFISCILLSIIYNFDEATRTHCGVANYFPSISTSIGDFSPQTYIWRICIALHCGPRFICSLLYFNWYRAKLKSSSTIVFKILNNVNYLLTTVEVLSLLVLTYVSSSENFEVHKKAFITFMTCSTCYMCTTCVLYYWTSSRPLTNEESLALRRKITIMLINYGSFSLAVYFYLRHHWYCEPGIYSLFALCEYVTVLSNIGFHFVLFCNLMINAWVSVCDEITSI